MAEFRKLIITNKGQALMAKMIAGSGNILFTKIGISSSIYTDAQIVGLTTLPNVKQTATVSKVTRTNNVAVQVEGAVTNSQLSTGYTMYTIALYANDPDDGEIIYAACGASNPGYMPPYNGVTTSGAFFKLITTVGNAENVSLNVDPAAVATIGDIRELQKQISDLQAYVGYTDADIYGVEVDLKNKRISRLAGSVNKTPGAMFDNVKAFGGRKRCNLTDDGTVTAYYGGRGYTDDGTLLLDIETKDKTYPTGTRVQTMVEQPKFYYKVVPLEMDIVKYYEKSLLTIKSGATADGLVNISLNNTKYGISVFAGDSVETVASRIRSVEFTGWTTSMYQSDPKTILFTRNDANDTPETTFSANETGVTATFQRREIGGIKKTHQLQRARYYVSDNPKLGFKIHPAFIQNGVEKKYIYLSAYEGCLYDASTSSYIFDDEQIADFTQDMLSSIAKAKPISGATQHLTRANARLIAQKRGAGWNQLTIQALSLTQLLFLIEYASFDIQEKIGIGVTRKNNDIPEKTGLTSTLGSTSGSIVCPTATNCSCVSYRGEENTFGNIMKQVDGINFSANNVFIADYDFADKTIDGSYKPTSITLPINPGFISAFHYSEQYDWLFMPSETIGGTISSCDYFTGNLSHVKNPGYLMGGYARSNSTHGLYNTEMYLHDGIYAANIGCRLTYIPQ